MRMLIVSILLVVQAPAPIFRFEADGFWLNLHHFLYVLGRDQNNAPDRQRRAVVQAPVDQANGLKGLSQSAIQSWEGAVRFYAGGLSKQDTVFDDQLVDVTNAMRVAPDATADALKVDPALRAELISASSTYRMVWWPKHRAENHARVRDLTKLIDQHGAAVLAYITRAYQEAWPRAGYPINISAYANWAGAYSTRGDLLVVSSLDEGTTGPLGLEIVFHEAMHQWDQQMLTRLERLSKAHGTPAPRSGITHALIWYTAAEAVRSVVPAHVGYAEAGGMWKQKGLGGFKAGLDTHWKPYLDGQGSLDAALLGLLKS
jgi:hypothetical protein